MKIDIITIFPDMFSSPFAESIVQRAIKSRKVEINTHNLRKWTTDKYQSVDDTPYGGGAGMVMKIEPIYKALEELDPEWKATRILLTAKGARIVQEKVRELSARTHLILICGHYEGVDHRVFESLVDERISIGDFVLSGGEIPAMAVIDAVVRLIPGALGNPESAQDESFSATSNQQPAYCSNQAGSGEQEAGCSYLEYPQYTKPEVFTLKDGTELKVPEILLSGDHAKVAKWREKNRKLVAEST